MGQVFASALGSVAEDAAGSAAGTLCNLCLVKPIFDQVTVLRNCNKNVADLKNGVEDLENEKKRVENCKTDAEREGKVNGDIYSSWLEKAEKLIKDAKELVVEGEKIADRECFFSLCPHPVSRYKISKKAERNLNDINQLVQQARGFNLPLFQFPPLGPDVAPVVEGFEEFHSRKIVLDQIMEALRSPTNKTIGVYGTSGVGKTMLVKMVKAKAKQDSLFTVVVMATVTKDRDLKSIQEDIARDLGLDLLSFRDHTDRQVADLIKAKLMKEQKFLVILDDVWDTEIDFEKFGILSASEMKKKNEESSSGQKDMLCKILLTSRFHDVLSSMIDEEDQVFQVHKLEDDEAWHLFKKIVGRIVESSNFQPPAKEIVEKCLGLPIAIVSVGKAMKGKTQQFQWEAALTELKRPSPDGISAAVYKPIELSYKYLQGDELKPTFMLCSLLGHDSSINDLIKYVMGLNLFRRVKTMEQTRAKVLTLVHSLKQSSLLVDGHSNMHFGMHDQIREVALSIASREHGVLALADEDVEQGWPEKETMENLKWIYLSNGYPELTSNSLKCPRLTFFHLSNKGCSLAVPTDLFTGTEGLKVLCLTKIDFQSMSSQIPLIPTKLQTLLLDHCVFRVEALGAIMGNLENLEVLSLAGCDIKELPREMEKLTKLKLLDVSDCTKLRVIPRQVLARLSKLEELKMGNSFDQWDYAEGGNARLAELTELRMLTALEVRILNFRGALFPANLERFKIIIGIVTSNSSEDYSWGSYSWNSCFESSKIMKLVLPGASIKSNDSVQKLLKKTEELYLAGLNGVENLVDELDDEGFQHLKCLKVQHAPDIRHVFNPAGRLHLSHVFPILEVLSFFCLDKMEKICHGLTGAAPFKVLRKMTVSGCHQLKNLFSFSMAGQLQLHEIKVRYCKNIEEIIDDVEEQGNGNEIVEESEGCVLGSLRSLTLGDLPKLISFNSHCSGISLFNDKVVFPKLEELDLSKIKINQLWITSSNAVTLQKILDIRKLKSLQIISCSSLEYLFTPSMVSGLVQLENLYVSKCQDLKQVIMVKGVEEVVKTELIFPRLNSIWLQHCNKLSSFYAGSYALKFQSAIKISIENCRNMITFASTFSTEQEKETSYRGTERCLGKKEPDIHNQALFNDTVDIPLLDYLNLISIGAPQIWHSQITSMSPFVQNLRKLTVWECDNLKYLFTLSMAKCFEQLELLKIWECEEMQVVILREELVEKEKTSQIMFPKLCNLVLDRLPQLIRFYSNCNSLLEVYEAKGLNGSGSQVLATTQSNLVETEVTQLLFPQVTNLELNCLPNFKGFFPQIHITKWPLLKRMLVKECFKVKTFASKFPSIEVTYGDNQLERQTQDPMFWISKDSFPCLEQLEIEQNVNMKEIWCGHYPRVYFPKLKDIKLLQFRKRSALPPFFLPSLPSLEKLVVSEASFHEIFLCEKLHSEGRPVDVPSRLNELKLSKLNGLKHLWKEESKLKSIFYNLRTLEVLECLELKNLVPSVASFENLQTLEISKCYRLENLVSYSTAKSLEQLKRMSITDCDFVEEIVKCLEDDVKDGIVFRQLKSLQLCGLPKLSSFCTRRCDFEFPSLKEVIVIGCPQMKYFSMGKTVTKELQNVQWINDEEKGHWVGDLNSTIQDLFTQKVGYFGFTILRLSEFSELFQIWKKNSEELTLPFKNVYSLEVQNCSCLSYLLTPSMVSRLVQLKCLKVKDCATTEQVMMATRVGEVVESDSILFPQLKSISLESCCELSSFHVGSKTLKFPKLMEITIKNCPKMVRFASKFSSEQRKETIDGRSEKKHVKKESNIFIETFFCDEVEFPELKSLKLSSININQIWHNQISKTPSSIKNLNVLIVEGCGNLKYLLTSSIVESFQQLTVLKICGCKMMKGVILIIQLEEKKRMRQICFPRLQSLVLQELPKLNRFCSGNFFEFPSLMELTIRKCSMLKTFISGSVMGNMTISTENAVNAAPSLFYEKVKFPNLHILNLSSINIHQIWNKNHENISSFEKLQHLEVCNFSGLSYLLTPSMALSLVQLKDLKIKDCATMEQVIMAAGVEEVVETGLIFPQLNYILLEFCSKLSSFYVGSNTLKFPMLKKITVKNCLKRFRFACKFSSDKEKEIAGGRSEEVHVKEGPDIFTKAFLCDEVEIPNLETLTLSSINTKQIWSSQLSSISSFAQNLTKLKVVNYFNLKYLFTFSMVKSFAQLRELEISGCAMMEVVILTEGTADEEKICRTMVPELDTLTLNDLPQLATFCSNCDSLGKISDSKRVNFSTESQKLLVTKSTLVETEATKLVFSQVIDLVLRLLPKFKNFFPHTHITEWPSLESLVVIECHGAQIVASEFSSTGMTHGDSQLERESQHLMFWISKATFPKLERLVVKWNDNIKVQCGHHPEEYFGKLWILHLLGFPKQSAFLLPFFFHSLPNLEELHVEDAFFDEIFQCEEVTGEEKPVCGRTPLRTLRLSKLHELTNLWKEESQLEVDILNNLETLKVQECSRLKNLVPSTVYFDNLQTLVVSECHGLVNIVRYSTAKSLGQLRRMKVANCEMIEEIVACSGDDVKDGIVFPSLYSLQLKGLPRLESFCSGDCNFKFPDLREVIITECPDMQIFSKGELSTPELQEVKLTGDMYEYRGQNVWTKIDDIFNKDEGGVEVVRDEDIERCWVGNLNSTVQQLFKEKRAHNSKKGNGENSDHGTKEDGN